MRFALSSSVCSVCSCSNLLVAACRAAPLRLCVNPCAVGVELAGGIPDLPENAGSVVNSAVSFNAKAQRGGAATEWYLTQRRRGAKTQGKCRIETTGTETRSNVKSSNRDNRKRKAGTREIPGASRRAGNLRFPLRLFASLLLCVNPCSSRERGKQKSYRSKRSKRRRNFA